MKPDFDTLITSIGHHAGPLLVNVHKREDFPAGLMGDMHSGYEFTFANDWGVSIIGVWGTFELAVIDPNGNVHMENEVARGDVMRGDAPEMLDMAMKVSRFNLKGELDGTVEFAELELDESPELEAESGWRTDAFVVPASKLVPGDMIIEIMGEGLFLVTNPQR